MGIPPDSGDFNAHNAFGMQYNAKSQRKLAEDVIAKHVGCLLNDNFYRYLHPATGIHLSLDLTLSSPAIYLVSLFNISLGVKCSNGSSFSMTGATTKSSILTGAVAIMSRLSVVENTTSLCSSVPP